MRDVVKAIVEKYRGDGIDAVEQTEFIGTIEKKLGWTGKTEFRNRVARELQDMGFRKRDGMYLLPVVGTL